MHRSTLTRLAVLTVLAGVLVLPATGAAQDDADAAALTAGLQAVVDRLPDVPAGDDRDELRALIGLPDAFTIAFEEGDDGRISRREQWIYYDLDTAFEFADGSILADRPLDDEAGLLVHASVYDPATFAAGATWEEIAPALPNAEAFEAIALDEGYGVVATVRVGDLLQLAFDADGELFHVEAVAISGDLAP